MNIIEKIFDTIYPSNPTIGFLIDCFISFVNHKKSSNRRLLKEIRRYQTGFYSPEQCLRQFLIEAKSAPFYNNLFNQYQIDTSATDIISELKKLPIITREIVIKQHDKIINPIYFNREDVINIGSSGTTATSLVFPCLIDSKIKQWAVWWRYRLNLGISFDMWYGWFGGNVIIPIEQTKGPFFVRHIFLKRVDFSAFHLTKDTVNEYYEGIISNKLKWLHGHAHNIVFLSTLILENHLQPIKDIHFITTGADSLFIWQRRIIQDAFPNALIRQHYGMTEKAANISEDINGDLQIDRDFAFVEFVPLEKDGNLCRIIGTAFTNPAFPLIRYDIGDLATVETLGDGAIKIKQIDGRTVDCIKLPNGRRVSSTSMTNFEYTSKVKEVQFYQNDLYNIYVRVVRREGYNNQDEMDVLQSIRERIPSNIAIHIEYVESIERTKSGKIRYIISNLD